MRIVELPVGSSTRQACTHAAICQPAGCCSLQARQHACLVPGPLACHPYAGGEREHVQRTPCMAPGGARTAATRKLACMFRSHAQQSQGDLNTAWSRAEHSPVQKARCALHAMQAAQVQRRNWAAVFVLYMPVLCTMCHAVQCTTSPAKATPYCICVLWQCLRGAPCSPLSCGSRLSCRGCRGRHRGRGAAWACARSGPSCTCPSCTPAQDVRRVRAQRSHRGASGLLAGIDAAVMAGAGRRTGRSEDIGVAGSAGGGSALHLPAASPASAQNAAAVNAHIATI